MKKENIALVQLTFRQDEYAGACREFDKLMALCNKEVASLYIEPIEKWYEKYFCLMRED